jgi:hypothetical protein
VEVPFRLDALAPVNLQAFYSGTADLALDVVTVCFADQATPPAFYRAQDLWRQTGDLAADAQVPGGLAVTARPGYHPPLYLMHGPQRMYPPGRYVAAFRLAGDSPGSVPAPDAPAVHLAVASDLGRITLTQRKIAAQELQPGYGDYRLTFTLERPTILGFRARYLGGAGLRLAGVSVTPSP